MPNDLSICPRLSSSYDFWLSLGRHIYIRCYWTLFKTSQSLGQIGLTSTLLNTRLTDAMANDDLPDYKTLFLEAERKREQAEERRKQAEEEQRREAGLRRQAEEQTRRTTFGELIRYGHNVVAKSLRVEHQSRCTSGKYQHRLEKNAQGNCACGQTAKLSRRKSIALFASILDQHKRQHFSFFHPLMCWRMTDKKSKKDR